MLIVAITGMPGAGKSTAAKALENIGMKRVVMGDVIREETKRRGLAVDEKNTGEVMRDLRKIYGEGAVAELCLKSIGKAKPDLTPPERGGFPFSRRGGEVTTRSRTRRFSSGTRENWMSGSGGR